MTDLDALIARLGEAKEGSRELDRAIVEGLHDGEWRPYRAGARSKWFFDKTSDRVILYGEDRAKPYTTSIDAALMLLPSGWGWEQICWTDKDLGDHWRDKGPVTCSVGNYKNGEQYDCITAIGNTGPLCLCIAALRARQVQP